MEGDMSGDFEGKTRPRREPLFNLPVVVIVSLGVLAAVHGVRLLLSDQDSEMVLALMAFAPSRYLNVAPDDFVWPGGLAAALWSPFTYALLHVDLTHLITNSVVFASIANLMARRMGALRFVVFCLVTAPLAAFGELIIASFEPAPVIGASGVVAAMMGALARFMFPPRRRAMIGMEPVEAEKGVTGADAAAGGETDPGADAAAAGLAEEDLPAILRPTAPIVETLKRPAVIQFIAAFAIMNLILFFAAPILLSGTGSGGVAWMVHVTGFVAGFFLFPFLDPVTAYVRALRRA
jgi:membrane associated rhomboid family serine protease